MPKPKLQHLSFHISDSHISRQSNAYHSSITNCKIDAHWKSEVRTHYYLIIQENTTVHNRLYNTFFSLTTTS